MVRKIIAALMLLCMSVSVSAQTRPSDVPAPVNPAATYKTDGTANILGDGSDARGGTMPVLAKQPADIPTPSGLRSTWTVANGGSSASCGTALDECKFRTIANFSHLAYDDPERNFGSFGASHLHTFFGSTTTNAYSTYASLRNRCIALATAGKSASSAAGGPMNCTGYWAPTPMKSNPFGDGKNYAVIPYYYVIYYVTSPGSLSVKKSRLPRGLRYVLGVNMDDPDNCGVKNELSLANGGSGTGCTVPVGRYQMLLSSGSSTIGDGTLRNGFAGWSCYTGDGTSGGTAVNTTAGDDKSQFLKLANGDDPWGGACTGPGSMVAHLDAPPCYNGQDLWVPGSYNHFRYKVRDTVTGNDVCPNGWYEVPTLTLTIWFRHEGPTDYTNWRLSSDDMCATVRGSPCPNGGSMHTDWFGGWDDATFYTWQQQCHGVDGYTPPSICDSSRFSVSPAVGLVVGGLVAEYSKYYTSSAPGMKLVPSNHGVGPATLNATPIP